MPRRGELVYKKKNRWEARYHKGRDQYGHLIYGSVYASTYREVKKKREKLLLALQAESQEEAKDQERLFCQAVEDWLVSISHRVKESSFSRYYNLAKKHILPLLGEYKIADITNRVLEQAVFSLQDSGRLDGSGGLSDSMVAGIVGIIKKVLRMAAWDGIRLSCSPDMIQVKHTEKQARVLSKADSAKLTGYLENHLTESNFGILLSLYSGLRLGEACALKWDDFTFEDNTAILHVRSTLQRIQDHHADADKKTKIITTPPKTQNSVRDIPLPDFITDYVKRMQRDGNEYVLTGSEKHLDPRSLQKSYSRIADELNIPNKNYHSLRHTFATYCIASGIDVKSLSEILGHSNVRITLNKYVHPDMDLKKQVMKKISPIESVPDS